MLLRREKRKSPRAVIQSILHMACNGRAIIGDPCDYNFHSCAQNIGEGGLKVSLGREVKKGTLLELELFVTEKMPLKCKGTVIWCRKSARDGMFDTGIEFTDIDPFYRKMVKNLTETFISKKR
jgi:hypothetical protein